MVPINLFAGQEQRLRHEEQRFVDTIRNEKWDKLREKDQKDALSYVKQKQEVANISYRMCNFDTM